MAAAKQALQLVLNVGSSSIKYALYRSGGAPAAGGAVGFQRLVQGLAEGIGTQGHCKIKHETEEGKATHNVSLPDHKTALTSVMELLPKETLQQGIGSVGHRIVHGGEAFRSAAVVDDRVLQAIREATVLAPLHNPWGLQGIEAASELFGTGCPQVAVFDTAFHQTMEPHAFLYALPYELYEKHGIRKYGFHGTSYQYVLGRTAELLGKPTDQVNCIICHIGNGASMAAIRNGKSVDTTMGLTPLEGLVMGTRSGDIDPAIPTHLMTNLGYSSQEVADLLNKKSGLLGLCGTSDDREIEQRAFDQEPVGLLAKRVQIHRMRRYLGSYWFALNGDVDAVVFTGGMAEKSHLLRTMVCEGLGRVGLSIDEDRNRAKGGKFSEATVVHSQEALERGGAQIWVVPTDEELCIAQQARALVHDGAA